MSTSTRVTGRKLTREILSRIAQDLFQGAVVIFPTETVYGIGASIFSPSAIRRIYKAKGRKDRKPLALLVPRLEAALPLVESIPLEAERLARRFWPGPLTLVLKANALGRLIMGGLDTVGVRVPDHPIALAILKTAGIPLATTSVNRSGEDPAVSGRAAAAHFGRHADWIIDGGPCVVKTASSVIDMTHFPYLVIREGAIPKAKLEASLLH